MRFWVLPAMCPETTVTLTQYVQGQYDGFNVPGAYAASVVLALLSVITLVAMTAFRRKEEI